MLERYKTVYRGKEGEIIEKKSRFIVHGTAGGDGRGSACVYRRDEKEILERQHITALPM